MTTEVRLFLSICQAFAWVRNGQKGHAPRSFALPKPSDTLPFPGLLMTKFFRSMTCKFQHAAQSSRKLVETQPWSASMIGGPSNSLGGQMVCIFPTQQQHIRYFALVV